MARGHGFRTHYDDDRDDPIAKGKDEGHNGHDLLHPSFLNLVIFVVVIVIVIVVALKATPSLFIFLLLEADKVEEGEQGHVGVHGSGPREDANPKACRRSPERRNSHGRKESHSNNHKN